MGFFDLIGMLGVGLLLAGYLLLQTGRLDSTKWTYSVLNLAGSAAILASLYADWNLAAATIEIAWCAISLGGLARSMARRHPAPAPSPATC